MRAAIRVFAMAAALAVIAPLASAYYYYVYFGSRNAPFVPVPVRFDLSKLTNNTVTYLISDQGPSPVMAGDSFPAIVSQIRAAAEVWNGVSTSSLRLAFGGLSPLTTPASTPEIDIVFDDNITPGLIATTFQTVAPNAPALAAGGASFIPLLRSRVQLRKDLTNPQVSGFPTASWDDHFFLTVVHELGHALGLQHTETASAMSTSITRATTKARPLTADDIAGISLLYPAPGFQSSTGSITGTVSMNGAGVNMAVVTALSASGSAVSALTNPDGSYRIDGVPPGQYFVYTHPLPPAQQGESYPDNITPPTDGSGGTFPANTGFSGQFFGGTTDWTQTPQVTVTAGASSDNVSFNVAKRSGPAAYDMVVYGYLGPSQTPVQAPPLQAGTRNALVFAALSTLGTTGYLQPSPGLNVSAIGGSAQVETGTVAPYASVYFEMVVDTSATVTTATPVALALTLNNDLYVLPIAFTVVPSGLPSISSVTGSSDAQGNSTVNIVGTNLGSSTRIVVDGMPARSQVVNADGSMTFSAPPAVAGYKAAIEALSADGQTSSLVLGSKTPPVFVYTNGPSFPSISVSPSKVSAGTDTMIEITGYNTNFVDGQTVVGFGSADVFVQKVWVISPARLLVNISVSPSAQPALTTVTVASGLQLTTASAAFQIAASTPGQISLRVPVLNHATHLAGVPAGGVVEVNTSGLPADLTGWTLTISNQPSPFTVNADGLMLAMVPAGLLPGPAVMQLTSPGAAAIPPVVVQIDLPAPLISSVVNSAGIPIDSAHPAQAGETITIITTGLADATGNLPVPAAVDVSFGGSDIVPLGVSGLAAAPAVQAAVPVNTPSGPLQITVRVATRLSAPFTIYIK